MIYICILKYSIDLDLNRSISFDIRANRCLLLYNNIISFASSARFSCEEVILIEVFKEEDRFRVTEEDVQRGEGACS